MEVEDFNIPRTLYKDRWFEESMHAWMEYLLDAANTPNSWFAGLGRTLNQAHRTFHRVIAPQILGSYGESLFGEEIFEEWIKSQTPSTQSKFVDRMSRQIVKLLHYRRLRIGPNGFVWSPEYYKGKKMPR